MMTCMDCKYLKNGNHFRNRAWCKKKLKMVRIADLCNDWKDQNEPASSEKEEGK